MGAFDDLTPQKSQGAFDDLVPAEKKGQQPKIDLTAPVGSEGFMGGVADLGRGLARGAISQLPEMVGKSIDFFADRPTETGAALQQFAKDTEEATPGLKQSIIGQRDRAESPYDIRGAAYEGGLNMPASVGPMIGGALAGGAIGAAGGPIGAAGGAAIGALSALPMFLGSQGHETQAKVEKAQLEAGAAPEQAHAEARKAGWLSGGIEAGGELVSDIIPIGALAKPLVKAGTKAAGTAVRSLFGDQIKKAAGTVVKTELGEISTEMAQQAGEAEVEKAYGAGEGATWKDTAQVIMPTAIMSLFPGGFAAAHNFKTTQDIKRTLGDGEADPEARAAAVSMVYSQLNGSSPQAAQAFALYARDQIEAGKPIEIADDKFYGDYLVEKARAMQFKPTEPGVPLLTGPEGARLGHAITEEDRQAAIAAAQAHADAVYAARDAFEAQQGAQGVIAGMAQGPALLQDAGFIAPPPGGFPPGGGMTPEEAQARADEVYRQRAIEEARQASLPSRRMGLDPAMGPISAMAAHAVDTGATAAATDQRAGPIAQAEIETQQGNIEQAAKDAETGAPAGQPGGATAPGSAPTGQQLTIEQPPKRADRYFPFPNVGVAQKYAEAMTASGTPSVVVPHPYQHDKYTVVPASQEAQVMAIQGSKAIPRAPETPPAKEPDGTQVETQGQAPQTQDGGPATGGNGQADGGGTTQGAGPQADLTEDELGSMFDDAAAEAKAEAEPPAAPPKAEQHKAPAVLNALVDGMNGQDAVKDPDIRQVLIDRKMLGPKGLTPKGAAFLQSLNKKPELGQPEMTTAEAQAIIDRELGLKPPKSGVDAAADQAATSPNNDLPPPTDGQKDAGNYKKGHQKIGGLDFSIENPKGSKRRPEWKPLQHHYGYIKGTVGKDKDHLDAFINPGTPDDYDGPVYIIDQIDPKTGKFDEHKIMVGFNTQQQAELAYMDNYEPGWKGQGDIKRVEWEGFKRWLKEGDTKAPFAPQHGTPAAIPPVKAEIKKYEPTAGDNPVKGTGDVNPDNIPLEMSVDDFNEVTDEWAALFEAPGDERVRMADVVKGMELLTPEEVAAQIAEWKEHAAKQKRANANRWVISLFDWTGQWSQPWVEAGYNVIHMDLQDGVDVNDLSVEWFAENYPELSDVWAILAAPPCTDFASSGARWMKAKDEDGRTAASVELVHQTLRTIEYFRPAIWALENPVGRIANMTGLPEARLTFDPNHFGDPYTKKTLLWGRFDAHLPALPVAATEGSKMWSQYGGKSQATKNARSETPEGFAWAFFMQNNAEDMPAVQRLSLLYPMASGAIKTGLEAGLSAQEVDQILSDTYDYDSGQDSRDAIAQAVKEKKSEPTVAQPRRFLSGLSRPGDFTKAFQEGANVGIEINELSAVSAPKLAKELWAAKDSHLFVDTGAYSVFRHNQRLEAKGEFEGYKELDWKDIWSRFEALESAIAKADEENSETGDDGTPFRVHFVMPDVVGNQAESLYLLREHADKIIPMLNRGAIIPLQAGKLSLVEAFDEAKEIFGGRTGWTVGIPTNMHAASDEQVSELIEKRGHEIWGVHILGGVADGKIAARIKALGDFDGEVSADANRLRSIMWGDTDRATAFRRALSEAKEPPVATVDGKRIPSVEELKDLWSDSGKGREYDASVNERAINDRFMPTRMRLQRDQMGGGYHLVQDGFIRGWLKDPQGPMTPEKARSWIVQAHEQASKLAPKRDEPKKLTAEELRQQQIRDATFQLNGAIRDAILKGGSPNLIESLENAIGGLGTKTGITAGMAKDLRDKIDALVEQSKKDPKKKWEWSKPYRESADSKKARLKREEEARKLAEKAAKEALRAAQLDAYNGLKNIEALVDASGKTPDEFEAVALEELGKWIEKRRTEVEGAAALNALTDLRKSDLTKLVKSLHDEAKKAAKIRAREAKKKADEKRKEGKKLHNTGLDLRRHWELVKAEKRKAEDADGTSAINRIFAATTRADLFADLLGEGATPGAKRLAEMMRDAVAPFKQWLVEAGPLKNSYRRYDESETERIVNTFKSEGRLHAAAFKGVLPEERLAERDFKPTLDERLDLLRFAASLYMDHVKEITDVISGKTGAEPLAKAFQNLIWKPDAPTEKRWLSWHLLSPEHATSVGERLGKGKIFDLQRLALLAPGSGFVGKEIVDENKADEETTRKKSMVPPRLEAIKREGLPEVRTGSVKPKALKEQFGFADIGFGTWVAAKEDQKNLDLAWDSFSDLARHVGIDPKAIGFFGKLHFTIGALGHGAKAAATFHPHHPGPKGPVEVINLTKTKGDGTVAHEWGHALDHFLHDTVEGKKAMQEIVRHLKERNNFDDVRSAAIRGLKFGAAWSRGPKDPPGVKAAEKLVRYYARNKGATKFKQHADAMDPKYWGNNQELFARAWEAWVADELGGVNNYLVNAEWVGEGRIKPPQYKGIPYPMGEERKQFNAMMKALTRSLIVKDGVVDVDPALWAKNMPDIQAQYEQAVEELIKDLPLLEEQIKAEAQVKQDEIAAKIKADREAAQKAAEEAQKREEEAQNPPPPPVVDPNAPLNEDALDALFDDAVSDLKAENNENPLAPEPGAPAFNEDTTVPPPKFEKPRMSAEDRDFFTKLLDQGRKILLAANEWGIPSIQSVPGAEFKGFGLFEARGPGWTITFDAGGEMKRSPGGVSYTIISETDGSYPYNTQGVRFDLIEAAGGTIQPQPPAGDKKAGQLIAEAAKLGVKGIDEALSGLTKLFGGGKIQSFPGGFDEDAYRQAKPHFEAALKAFQDAGKTLKDLFKLLVQQFGEGVKPYAIRFAQDMKLTAGLGQNKPAIGPSSSMRVANWVRDELLAGRNIEWPALFAKANEAFGGTQADGKYTPKDAYDAAEAGMNLWLMSDPDLNAGRQGGELRLSDTLELPPVELAGMKAHTVAAIRAIEALKARTAMLPTQTKRTAEMDEFQQFSTVPGLAYLANWVANITPGETYLEPSGGIGGLAVFGKLAGAKLVVNELSSRRAALLRDVLPDAQVFTENAEQIDNILPDSIRPTTIVMNPPFSATAGRMEGARDNRNGIRHLNQALERLAPGGRLVAVMGRGMSLEHALGREFVEEAKKRYTVRALITLDGKEYAKYGTTFDNVILVIDKVGPHTGDIVTGHAAAYSEVPALLDGVRNARREPTARDLAPEPGTDQPDRGGGTAPGLEEPGKPERPGPGVVGPGTRTGTGSGSGGGGTSRPGSTSTGTGAGAGGGNGGRTGPATGGSGGRGTGGSGPTGPGPAGGAGELELDAEGAAKRDAELTESTFENYAPLKARVKGSKPHPGKLVESAAMAAVDPLDVTYTPNLPASVITSGALSDAQIESIIYAGQAHAEMLPAPAKSDKPALRRGFFIGDGTGVGKGREIAGILLDNWRQNRKKAVWISAKQGLIEDAKRDMRGVWGEDDALFSPPAYGRKVEAKQGVLFTTYDTLKADKSKRGSGPFEKGAKVRVQDALTGRVVEFPLVGFNRDANRVRVKGTDGTREFPYAQVLAIDGDGTWMAKIQAKNNAAEPSRLQQLVNWLGPDFDGVIVFDEAHKMANLGGEKGARGTKKASQMAKAGFDLQEALPNARIVYVSATGATEVSNLMYATRLGLWGSGTPFPTAEAFHTQISSAGLAAMELVARDLKAAGGYLARALSYDGVEQERMNVQLSQVQTDIYDELARAWQIVLQNIRAALEATNQAQNGQQRGQAMSAFWGTHQRFFNQIITWLQIPEILDRAKAEIAAGNVAVFQLVNTNEAAQERMVESAEADGTPLEELDFSPKQGLIEYLRNSFPITQFHPVTDANGNTTFVPTLDSQGNPVVNREAVRMRDALIEKIDKEIQVKDNPIDLIIEELGVENVAEVTGRSRRFIKRMKRDGSFELQEQKRGADAMHVDAAAFMDDKKSALIFSDAGGTGYSFHSDKGAKNQKRRVHFLVQAGWRADNAVQGFGRTHRSNEVNQPLYILPSTNLKAQKRFISSIARRLDQLGALTKGQRDTASQGLFTNRDNLESTYARAALRSIIDDMAPRARSGLTANPAAIVQRADHFLTAMGLSDIYDNDGKLIEAKMPSMTQFLNRLLSLTVADQDVMFGEFETRMDAAIDHAIERGTFDDGMQTVKALKVIKTRDETVNVDPRSKAATRYVELELHRASNLNTWEKAQGILSSYPGKGWAFYQDQTTGQVFAAVDLGTRVGADGRIQGRGFKVAPLAPSPASNGQYITNLDQIKKGGDYRFVVRSEGGDLETATSSQRYSGEAKKMDRYRKLTPDEAEFLWNEAYDAAPRTQTSTLNLLTGVLLPVWDRVSMPGDDRVSVVRTQTDDGERFIGRQINEDQKKRILTNFGLGMMSSDTPASSMLARIMAGATARLSNSWMLQKVRVSNENRIEIKASYLSPATLKLLRDEGAIIERIGFAERAFIPPNPEAFEALTRGANRPVVEIMEPTDGGASFSLGSGGGMMRAAVALAVNRITRNWRSAPPVTVVQSVKDLPPEFKAPARARGVFYQGQVYLVADNIRSKEAAEFVLLHEIAGHYGLKSILGDQLKPMMQSIYRSNARIREMADKRIAHAAQNGLLYDLERATEEALADIAGEGGLGEVRGWKLLVAKVRQILRDLGFTISVSDEEVAALLMRARDTLGGPGGGVTAPAFSTASSPFFSALQAGIGSAPFSKAGTIKADQLKSWLASRVKDGKFKQDEVEWTGINEWLDTQSSVSRDDVQQYLSQNGVTVGEELLGSSEATERYRRALDTMDEAGYEVMFDDYAWHVSTPDGTTVDPETMRPEVREQWEYLRGLDTIPEMDDDGQFSDTRYGSYQLPGGSHYRELLLTLTSPGKTQAGRREQAIDRLADMASPIGTFDNSAEFEKSNFGTHLLPGQKAMVFTFRDPTNTFNTDGFIIERTDGTYEIPAPHGSLVASNYKDAVRSLVDVIDELIGLGLPNKNEKRDFTEGHFNLANVLAHTRVNERTDADGRRVLFVEEIQSDWAQRGRTGGFAGDYGAAAKAYKEFVAKMREDAKTFYLKSFDPEQIASDSEVVQMARKMGEDLSRRADERSIARVMFLDRQYEQLRYNTFDHDKPPLAPFVEKTDAWTALVLKRLIRYAAENGYERVAWTKGVQQIDRWRTALRQRVDSIAWETKDNGTVEVVALRSTVPVFTGKFDPTYRQFFEGPANNRSVDEVLGKSITDKIMAAPKGEIFGDDLAVGGKGMQKFYDEIVPQVANKLLRQLGGGKVIDVTIKFPGRYKSIKDVRPGVPAPEQVVQHQGFDITPAVRERALEAQPLFSLDGVMGAGIEAVKATFDNPRRFNWWHRTVGTQFHKAQAVPAFRPVFEASQRYLQDVSQLAIDASDRALDWLPRLGTFSDVLNIFGGPKKADMAAVSKLMFQATLEAKRPDAIALKNLTGTQRKLYTQARAAIDMSLEQVAKSELHKLTADEKIDLARAQAKDLPLKAALDLLTSVISDQIDVAVYAGKEHEVKRKARLLDQMQEVVDKVDKLKAEGYVPLMRFGQYAVDVTHVEKDKSGKDVIVRDYFGMFETNREAAAMAKRMQQAFPQSKVERSTMDDESWKLFKGLSLDSLHTFADSTGLKEHHLFQEYYKLAVSSRSALTRLIHRKGIAGYDEDMQRVLASFITSNARLAARNYHFGEMQRAATRIPDKLGDVKAEASRLVDYVQNPVEEAHRVRGLLFVNFLGGSVASALTNATQPVLMSMPYLSQFGGAAQATRELIAAAGIAAGSVPSDPALRAALDRASKEGITDPQELHQLYAESIRGLGSSLPVRRALKVWGSAFSLAESFNRKITFAAAFAIAQKQGMADPFAFAEKAVEATQGVYNRGNRPNWARGTIGATVFTFKQYSIAYLEFLKRLPPKEKAIALSLLVLAAGMQGLPGADDLEDLIDTIGQMLGYNTNSKQTIREFAIDTLGDTLGGFLIHGASGLPGSPIDVQQRMGLGNFVPGTGLFMRSNPDKGREIAEAVGPIGGVYTQAAKGVEAILAGQPGRAARQATPIAVQNAMQGAEMWETGVYKDSQGRKVVDVTKTDAAFKAIGIQPKSVGEKQRVAGDVQQSVRMVRAVEASIADRWVRGIIDKDPAAVQKAVAELHAWNLANPDWKILITPAQIKSRVEATMISRDQRLMKSAPPEVRARVLQTLRGE